jgi:hypothetical protein
MDHSPIPVLCDCCRARGVAGEGDFADLGGLLIFAPVPRKKARADGWTAEVQRLFMIALAATGSERQAAHAVGKAQYGVTQLKNAEGGESFARACAAAKAIFAENRRRQMAEGVDAAARAASWRGKPPVWAGSATRQKPNSGTWRSKGRYREDSPAPGAPASQTDEDAKKRQEEGIVRLLRKYAIKIREERRARLEGKIVEADYYLRQMSWFEACIDLAGTSLLAELRAFRHNGRHLIDIAATPMALLLDKVRRGVWAEMGEPPRPEHPPQHLIKVDPDGIVTEPLEFISNQLPLSHEEQQAAFEAQHRKDAEAQAKWEAEALADYEERCDRDAAS